MNYLTYAFCLEKSNVKAENTVCKFCCWDFFNQLDYMCPVDSRRIILADFISGYSTYTIRI